MIIGISDIHTPRVLGARSMNRQKAPWIDSCLVELLNSHSSVCDIRYKADLHLLGIMRRHLD